MNDARFDSEENHSLSTESKAKRPISRFTKFARDVLVNVLANLIAAAVIYLAGAGAGLLPSSPQLIAASLSMILACAFFGLVIISRFTGGHLRYQMTTAGIAISGPAMMAATFAGVLDNEPFPRWFFYGTGAYTTIAGLAMFYYIRQLDAEISSPRKSTRHTESEEIGSRQNRPPHPWAP